ncbi:hypothetical protein QBC37DRAFT_45376 [Rhypophila decipiens]|uniref:Uncharacterized protein n=1 Tax=Rhypophila decipiens TaxID=261697 RepID=A0AAN6XZJ8_9PEZI|nr:hypothetical protein QBC37DRAFT_45376 [Rhypophila decipiens]
MESTIPLVDRVAGATDAPWPSSPATDALDTGKRRDDLQWYYDYSQDEKKFVLARDSRLLDGTTLPDLIRHLKNNTQKTKKQLVEEICLPDDANIQKRKIALEPVVRIAFMTACSAISQETFGGELFRPGWHNFESLETYINRVYPRDHQVPQDGSSIRIDKLSAGYLTAYSKLEIIWTHRLTDHLILHKRAYKKTLSIFRHPAFLRTSLDVLDVNNAAQCQSPSEALSIGCLPPQLIRETLATYSLLFPEPGDEVSRTLLEKEVTKHNLDAFFLRPFPSSSSQSAVHEHPLDALDPDDVRSLYRKYPYWAERLYSLWKEAEDPTPVTIVERWSESRKNPRFTYWCTVVSLSIAIAFGAVATMLGALQVWISYCSWLDDPGVALCSKGGSHEKGASPGS